MGTYYVYILASKRRGTLYVGVIDNLIRRVFEHREELLDGFTKSHKLHRLVYFEEGFDITEAIQREKQFKRWKRAWKIDLIESKNPKWKDLYPSLVK